LNGAPPAHEVLPAPDRVRSNGLLDVAAVLHERAVIPIILLGKPRIAQRQAKPPASLTEAAAAFASSSLERSRCSFGNSIFFDPWHREYFVRSSRKIFGGWLTLAI
jgi:hypothetical protein